MSLPITPPTTASTTPLPPDTPSSDDSSILELSFDYEIDSEGKYVRVAKGGSHRSSPPTPVDLPQSYSTDVLHNVVEKERKSSPPGRYLSRSESLHASEQPPALRSFQRVASTPAGSSLLSTNVLTGTGNSKIGLYRAQRVPMEQYREMDEKLKQEEEERKAREEKENIIRSITSASSGWHGMSGYGRARSRQGHRFGADVNKIPEVEGSESEHNDGIDDGEAGQDAYYGVPATNSTARQRAQAGLGPSKSFSQSLSSSTSTRPRRSASLSETSTPEDKQTIPTSVSNLARNVPPPTYLGLSGNEHRARRVTMEENARRAQQIARETAELAQKEAEEEEAQRRAQAEAAARSQSPHSPPYNIHQRPHYSHQRRDSDTLRSLAVPSTSYAPQSQYHPNQDINVADQEQDPAAVPLPGRLSPSARNMQQSQSHYVSSLSSSRHRRSPTAPEHPTTSGAIAPAQQPSIGRTWAAGEDVQPMRAAPAPPVRSNMALPTREKQREKEREKEMPPPPPPPTTVVTDLKGRTWTVNKKSYARLDMVGKGGSSRVYRVMNGQNEIFAIKRVALDKTDNETMSGYMNEIALLKRLEGNSRIIRLIDSEVKGGPGGSKGYLMLVMECGEIDLAKLLQEQQKKRMNMIWVAYYWQQMLEAVHVIHEEKIVHSDLKPANFVLVRGELKLIDFGIANAIANDTTNIQRDHQIGTLNYMSPEAIELPDGMRRLKVGRSSDVWSLGCILYQMVYGHPPFHHLTAYQKMKAIPDPNHLIEFPAWALPALPSASSNSPGESSSSPPKRPIDVRRAVRKDIIRTMQSCLCRNPKDRAAIPQLLQEDWLAMKEPEPPKISDLLKDDETVINPYYMRQLIDYAAALGQRTDQMEDDHLDAESRRLVTELQKVAKELEEHQEQERLQKLALEDELWQQEHQ